MFLAIIQVPSPRKEIMSTVRVVSPTALATIVAPLLSATARDQPRDAAHVLTSYLTAAAAEITPPVATPM